MTDLLTLDHHNGKAVSNVVAGDTSSTIIFEDGGRIDVPGGISADIIGQVLLSVDATDPPTLVFGYTQAGQEPPTVTTAEIPVPQEDSMSAEEPKPNGDEEPAAEPGAEPAEEPAADDGEPDAATPEEDPEEASAD